MEVHTKSRSGIVQRVSQFAHHHDWVFPSVNLGAYLTHPMVGRSMSSPNNTYELVMGFEFIDDGFSVSGGAYVSKDCEDVNKV